MSDKYIFPAVFDPCEEGGFSVTFPDLPGCITEGDTLEEAFTMAREALELHLWGMEEDNDPIPWPTPPNKVPVTEGGFTSLIEAIMPPIRDKMANKAVNKTLTLPKWLNDLAEKRKVSCSRLLQDALKDYLGVRDYSQTKKQP
ncbi:type II toxin-antitoxin system HicB family antitoxin [Pelotomaculum propionicicum]|uniref:Antitoxin HicB n=1 Tax=Pelotomaculum propionicicum TaxID=258475 RepID=A0A4Y7RSJ1_9FIRM|nr:type II toxin-antitoxin system HicB family antitoxin [Pelotomaculum propionicicum]TEB11689.1 Antitoxin HicB [Pelotomaculum propionicicum]